MSVGIPASHIKVTGIPISDKFEAPIDKDAWLRKHKLDPENQRF